MTPGGVLGYWMRGMPAPFRPFLELQIYRAPSGASTRPMFAFSTRLLVFSQLQAWLKTI